MFRSCRFAEMKLGILCAVDCMHVLVQAIILTFAYPFLTICNGLSNIKGLRRITHHFHRDCKQLHKLWLANSTDTTLIKMHNSALKHLYAINYSFAE